MELIFLRKHPQKLAVVRQYLVTILASLPFAVAGAAVAWPSPALPRLLTGDPAASLDAAQSSWTVSLLYLGEAAAALPAVYLSDTLGRKRTLLYSSVFPLLSWSLLLASETPLCLYVSRFLSGLQTGVLTVVCPLYVGEISQADVRGSLTALTAITLNAGVFFVYTLGPFVSSQFLAAMVLLLSVLFPIGFRFAPESPHFHLTRDDVPAARKSLSWLRGDLNRIELEFELDRIEKLVKNRTQLPKENPTVETFSSKTLRKLTLVVLLMSALDGLSGVNVIQSFATVTFPRTAFGILTPNDCMIIIGSTTLLASFLSTCVSAFLYGKKLGVVSYCGSSLSMAAVAIWFFSNLKTEIDVSSVDFVPFLGCSLHLILCSFANFTSLTLINSHDHLSSKLKTNLTALSTITKAGVYFVLCNVYLQLAQREGVYVNFLVYSISCLLAALFFAIFSVSTVSDKPSQDELYHATEDESNKSSISSFSGSF